MVRHPANLLNGFNLHLRWSTEMPYCEQPIPAEIYDLLYQLGITANYYGFYYASYAVYLAMQQPERLLLITKFLYPDVAKKYKTNWKCVERNIRTVINISWKTNRTLLIELAHGTLLHKPTASQFIAILAFHFLTSSET